ncbi:uncharacterized protein [Mytilus edulis]|uniref:uncharacterized protein isoform X1 n=1 Tax=Mytilus edulis TaxID=6550 RepID=UPI0039F05D59
MAQLQHRVVELISKKPSLRRDSDIQVVLPWLRRKSDLLKDLDNTVLTDVIRNCDYTKACRDDVVIKQGDTGDRFFIMLTGTTSVYIDTVKSDEENAVVAEEMSEKDVIEKMLEEETGKKKKLDRKKYGKFILHYEAGKSFGEVALMSEDAVRNATVIADEETDLLVVSRELFNRSMKAKQEEEYKEREDFIQKCPLFRSWTSRFKRLLELSIRKETFPFGTVIARQGEPVSGLFFILSGQAKSTVQPALHHQQYPQLMKLDVNEVAAELGRENYNKLVQKKEKDLTQEQIKIRRKEGYAAAERHRNQSRIELCSIEENDLIGDLEMVLDLETNYSTVTCTANTVAMVLDTKNYDRLVAKKNQQTVIKMCQTAAQKMYYRLYAYKGDQIPILKCALKKLNEKIPRRPESKYQRKPVSTDKSKIMETLIELFLQGKGPLIEPYVPDSLYYRKMSARKAKHMEQSKKLTERLHPVRKRRTIPRSLKQLKRMDAENELLHVPVSHETTIVRSFVRPGTALGIKGTERPKEHTKLRPKTATERSTGFFITEVDGEYTTNVAKPFDSPQIFEQMDQIQHEKSEARSNVICTLSAKEELRNYMKQTDHGTESTVDGLSNDDFFDWETSDSNLRTLEDRLKDFCSQYTSTTRGPPLLAELKRFYIKDEREEENAFELKVPRPGGTVYVRTKQCDGKTDSHSGEHHHVRHYVISRDDKLDTSAMLPPRPIRMARSSESGSRASSRRLPRATSITH